MRVLQYVFLQNLYFYSFEVSLYTNVIYFESQLWAGALYYKPFSGDVVGLAFGWLEIKQASRICLLGVWSSATIDTANQS